MLNSDLIVSIFCILLGALFYFVTRDLSHLGGVFINYLLVVIGFLSLIIFIKGIVKPERIQFFRDHVERNSVVSGVIILGIYLGFMPFAGFLPSSYVFYAVFNLYLADERTTARNIIQSALLSALVVTLFYVVFYHFLQVPLPTGSWFEE
ncbi:tripartite tricarboxylate transporter TctB family protein [bacterium]|nr:tripartite tricarboxylate transporter TctB family protein [bacterium]